MTSVINKRILYLFTNNFLKKINCLIVIINYLNGEIRLRFEHDVKRDL